MLIFVENERFSFPDLSYRVEVSLEHHPHVALDAGSLLPASAGETLQAQHGGGQ